MSANTLWIIKGARMPTKVFALQSLLLFWLLSLALSALASGRKPSKSESTRHKVDEGLNTMEKDIKKAAKKAKKAGNEALEKVDEGVHKALKP